MLARLSKATSALSRHTLTPALNGKVRLFSSLTLAALEPSAHYIARLHGNWALNTVLPPLRHLNLSMFYIGDQTSSWLFIKPSFCEWLFICTYYSHSRLNEFATGSIPAGINVRHFSSQTRAFVDPFPAAYLTPSWKRIANSRTSVPANFFHIGYACTGRLTIHLEIKGRSWKGTDNR